MKTKYYDIFSIKSDDAHEYNLEKVDIQASQLQQFLSVIKKIEKIQITGLYGNLHEVQKNLLHIFGIKSLEEYQPSKGKIAAITINDVVIICLVIEDAFFQSKPIDEKTILLTLFRIFLDLTTNIHLCLPPDIFNNWYQGQLIPFSDINVTLRKEFILQSNEKLEQQELTLNMSFPISYCDLDQQISYFQSSYLYHVKLREFTKDDQKNCIEKEFKKIIEEIIQVIYNNEVLQIGNLISKRKIIKRYKIILEDAIEKYIKDIKRKVQKLKCKSVNDTSAEIKINMQQFIQQLFFKSKFDYWTQYKFTFQRGEFKIFRDSSNSETKFKIDYQLDDVQTTNLINYQSKPNAKPNLVYAFKASETNYEVFIFQDNEKYEYDLYLINKKQFEWNYLSTICNTSNAVFYYNQKLKSLYCFNLRNNKQIVKVEIQDVKSINSSIFCEQIDENKAGIIIKEVAYLALTKKFVLLTVNNQLFTLCVGSKKICSKSLSLINNQSQIKNFQQLLSCPSGKYFYITDFNKCFMYDCNFHLLKEMNIEGKLIVFNDCADVFLLSVFNKQNELSPLIIAKVLTNLIEHNSLKLIKNNQEKIEGNPAFDIIKGQNTKFGPLSSFLFANSEINLFIKQKQYIEIISMYLKQLALGEVTVSYAKGYQYSKVDLSVFANIIQSRVPLQLCTIENGTLIPLINGFRKLEKYKNESIHDLANSIQLGYLEDKLNQITEKIYVVSIIGKQSSGKSYLLNRIFGTRYSVAASRCTNGIWASLCEIEKQYFFVLDCEGLFSVQRTQNEEVKMLAFLTAISDMTLLNQDLTFNRYLQDLLDNLSSASDQLEGNTLFKGNLTIVLRDISANDNHGIDDELIQNINQQKVGENSEVIFLVKLFDRKFCVEKLFNFENIRFDEQVINMRKQFVELALKQFRWQNGNSLKSIIKILLSQLQMSDKTNASLIQEQEMIRQLIGKQKSKIFQSKILKDDSERKKTFSLESECLSKEDFHFIELTSLQPWANRFSRQFQFELNPQLQFTFLHNELLIEKAICLKQELDLELTERINILNQQFKSQNWSQEAQESIKQEMIIFQQELKEEFEQNEICLEKCQKCFLFCSKFKAHTKNQLLLNQIQIEIEFQEQLLKQKQTGIQTYQNYDSIQKSTQEIESRLKKNLQDLQFYELYFSIQQENIKYNQIKIKLNRDVEKFKSINYFQEGELDFLQQEIDLLNNNNKPNKLEKKIEEHEFKVQVQKCQQQSLILELNCCHKQSSETRNSIQQLNDELRNCEACIELFNNQRTEKINSISKLQQQLQEIQIQEGQKQEEQLSEVQQQLSNKKLQFETWKKEATMFIENTSIDDFFSTFSQYAEYQEKIEEKIIQKNNLLGKLKKELKINLSQKEKNLKLSKQYKNEIEQLEEQQILNFYTSVEQIKQLKIENIPEIEIFKKFKAIKTEEEDIYINQINELESKLQKLNDIMSVQKLTNQISNLEYDIDNIDCEMKLKIEKKSQVIKYIAEKIQLNDQIIQKTSILENEEHQCNLVLQNLQSQMHYFAFLLEQKADLIEFKLSQDNLKSLEKQFKSLQREQLEQLEMEEIKKKINDINEEIETDQKTYDGLYKQLDQIKDFKQQQEVLNQLEYEKQNLLLKKDEHSCQRESHNCDYQCQLCSGELCKGIAGHQGQHFCSKKSHQCSKYCEILKCKQQCQNLLNHEGMHLCQNFHQCVEKCKYCFKQCEIDGLLSHQNHFCNEKLCDKKCCLCNSRCQELHQHSLEENDTHYCNLQQHLCIDKCQHPGVCIEIKNLKIKIIMQENIWQSGLCTFQYINYIQLAQKKTCQQIIIGRNDQIKHIHQCYIDSEQQFHSCSVRCPECQAFCVKKYGHEGEHYTHQHRNKEQQIFTLYEGDNQTIIIDNVRKYQVGDSASPETCAVSCERRGRNHFHLVKCQGQQNCLEHDQTYQPYVRHSQQKYQNFNDTEFDEILCVQYWKLINWTHPNPKKIQKEISKCNFYCQWCGEVEKSFCQSFAWHSDSEKYSDHSFNCQENHIECFFKGIDICFVIDSTHSMKQYLEQSKEVIIEIMKIYKRSYQKEIDLRFAIVTYKDHLPNLQDLSASVVNCLDFKDDIECINFLQNIKVGGGYDTPEAVLDGLNASLSLNWHNECLKMLYLIADSPPHGCNKEKTRVYHHYQDNYPDGCPCKLTQTPILRKMQELKIKLKIIKFDSSLELMISEFRQDFKNLQVFDMQNKCLQFIPVIVNDVCRAMSNNEITYKV